MSTLTLVPAYGRDYKSKASVLEDWNANKDFIIMDISSPWDGKPANKQDLDAQGIKARIRYKNKTQIVQT